MNKYLKYFLDFIFGGVGLIVLFVVDGLFEGFGGLPLGNYIGNYFPDKDYSLFLYGLVYAFIVALIYKLIFRKSVVASIIFFLGAYSLYAVFMYIVLKKIASGIGMA